MIDLVNIQIEEAGTEPVSLDDLKAWAIIDHTDHDDLITSMGVGARQDIEQYLGGVKLVDSTINFHMITTKDYSSLYQFPGVLNTSNMNSLTVSTVEDGVDDVEQTLNEGYYMNGSLKIVSAGTNRIEYTVSPVVPVAIQEAIKMLVAYRYNNRGDQEMQQGLPEDIQAKVNRYKQVCL